MKLAVTSPDLRWKGARLAKGDTFEATTERDLRLADLLVRIEKAEEVKAGPVRRAHVPAPQLDHDRDGRPGGSVPETSEEAFDDMEDDQLRDFIEKRDGERPHPRTGRVKLLAAAKKQDPDPAPGHYLHRAMKAEGAD